jgi:protein-S-isoprenylcysteine O-methyltransferase Ste14
MTIGNIGIGILLWQPITIYLPDRLSLILSALGVIIYFSGTGLYLWGLVVPHSQFGVSGLLGAELYKEHELITSGPFGILRHPIYVGVLLAAVGALLIFRTWAMLIFSPMSLVVIGLQKVKKNYLSKS